MKTLRVGLLAVLSVVAFQSPLPVRAALTEDQLAAIVQEVITDNQKAIKDKKKEPVAIAEPDIRVRDGTLGYVTLGGIKRSPEEYRQDEDETAKDHWYPAKPLEVPLDLQFRIEVLREFIKKDRHKTFTEETLKKLSQVVREEVALIAKHRGTEEKLMEELCKVDRKAYRILIDALKARAAREKLTFKGLISEGQPGFYTVRFTKVPKDGDVCYLTLAGYKLAKKHGTLEKKETWWAAGEAANLPDGNYVFCVFVRGVMADTTSPTSVNENREVKFGGAGG